MEKKVQVGFVGLGIMGGAISNNLLKAGHEVIGYDVSPAALAQFVANGGQVAKSPLEVANTTPYLFTSLPTEKVVREVFTGASGICQSQLPNVVMELSTMPLTLKMDMHQAMQDANKYFLYPIQ